MKQDLSIASGVSVKANNDNFEVYKFNNDPDFEMFPSLSMPRVGYLAVILDFTNIQDGHCFLCF